MLLTHELQYDAYYFMHKIMKMPEGTEDIWAQLDPGSKLREYRKPTGTGPDDYIIRYFPECGSEQARFMHVVWSGTWEDMSDIDSRKVKKLKFLNDIPNLRNRYIELLQFVIDNGPRRDYWSKMELLPEDV